jgi:hypothetical protein
MAGGKLKVLVPLHLSFPCKVPVKSHKVKELFLFSNSINVIE